VKRYTSSPDDVPHARTTVRIYGEPEIEIWEAMCAASGLRPHELAASIVLRAIRDGQYDHATQRLAQIIRRQQRPRAESHGRAWRLQLRYRGGAGDEVPL
jgi:hypothetical protein